MSKICTFELPKPSLEREKMSLRVLEDPEDRALREDETAQSLFSSYLGPASLDLYMKVI